MSREDLTDLALLTLAALSVAGIVKLQQSLRPLPLHRRIRAALRVRVGR